MFDTRKIATFDKELANAIEAELAAWICDILDDISNPNVIKRVRGQVTALCKRLAVYARS